MVGKCSDHSHRQHDNESDVYYLHSKTNFFTEYSLKLITQLQHIVEQVVVRKNTYLYKLLTELSPRTMIAVPE